MRRLKPLVTKTFVRDLNWIKSNVKVDKKTGCWEWQKSTSDGYGQFVHILKSGKGRSYRVHRYVYRIVKENIHNDLLVRHMCDNRLCCNPDHLEKGSSFDNYHDSKNIHVRADKKRRGRRAHNCLLSDKSVFRYKKAFAAGLVTMEGISSKESISISTVRAFLCGDTYKDVGRKYTKMCKSHLKDLLVPGMGSTPLVSGDILLLIKQYRKQGKSDYAIADITGLKRSSINQWRRENNIP